MVRDLCGHGVRLEFHEEPEVCHFGRKGTGMLLVPGMVFTIEPMINAGTWHVFIDEEDGWARRQTALRPMGTYLLNDRDGVGDFDPLIR